MILLSYDPSQFKEVVDEYRRVEEAKRLLKEQKLKEENDDAAGTSQTTANNEDSDDEDKYADKVRTRNFEYRFNR